MRISINVLTCINKRGKTGAYLHKQLLPRSFHDDCKAQKNKVEVRPPSIPKIVYDVCIERRLARVASCALTTVSTSMAAGILPA